MFDNNAEKPTPVLSEAVVLAAKAALPSAVLVPPVVFDNNAEPPIAVLEVPEVFALKAA